MVLITGVVAAVTIPRWSGSLYKYRVKQAADRIAADLALAKSTAYSSSASKTVTFIVGSSQYSVAGITPLNSPTGTYTIQLSGDPYRSTLVSVWGQSGTQSITFNGYGLPDRGGNIVVAAGGQQKTIVVDATLGTAVVQ